jgi:hypothetical protein
MNDIAKFHTLATELLHHIGFELDTPGSGQDLFTLLVDDSYTLHLGLLDNATGFARAELPDAAHPNAALAEWLQNNAFSDAPLQPVIGLDASLRPMCYFYFPVELPVDPRLIQAFLAMLSRTDMLCGQAPTRTSA